MQPGRFNARSLGKSPHGSERSGRYGPAALPQTVRALRGRHRRLLPILNWRSGPVMPFLAPSFAHLPPLDYLLADQVEPCRKVARHLGTSLRTLQRYEACGNAPCAGYLALWFESRWGMAALHTEA